ncbi:MAG: metallophosphoesterase family protein [Alphaproteobacteria bacterium]|nr:metallophosphoesterase family protein [Alphaproteobacteria bacterium]
MAGYLQRLAGAFGAGRAPKTARCVPPNRRIYAIGDIHGRMDLLADLHDQILKDAAQYADCTKTIVYIGDYVDRGLNSKEVIQTLIEQPLPGFECVYLKGNHEAILLDFVEDARAGAGWLKIGGLATLFSYRVALDEKLPGAERLADAQDRFREKLPSEHLAFLKALRLHHTEGDYLFVHAGVRPRRPLDDQTEQDLLWIRDDFVQSKVDHGKIVVHGHSITWKPEIRPNRIGIDTGAFATGVLTCLALHGSEHEFIQAKRGV